VKKIMVKVASARELTSGISGVGTGILSGLILNKILETTIRPPASTSTPLFSAKGWIHMIISGGCLLFGKPELGLGYILGATALAGYLK
jgi:hypothetical protein